MPQQLPSFSSRSGVMLAVAFLPLLAGQAQCPPEDADGDGWAATLGDCDDTNAAVYPGATELCNGLDDDCNALVDDGCLATAASECQVSLIDGTVHCSADTPLTLTSTSGGMVYDIDMSQHACVLVDASLENAGGWMVHLADSPTCDGLSGDAGTSSNDAEAQIFDWAATASVAAFAAYVNDYGRDSVEDSCLLYQDRAVDLVSDTVTILACDGRVEFSSEATGAYLHADSQYAFQIEGTEPDSERGYNDRRLHLGLNRVVGGSYRSGFGVVGARVTFYDEKIDLSNIP